MSNTLLNSTLPSLPSPPTRPPLPPPPLLLPLSATGPREFPRARGSPLSVSSDTVIRSVGTESVPLSEPHAPSFHWPSPFAPLTPSPPSIPLHFLCHLSIFCVAPHLCTSGSSVSPRETTHSRFTNVIVSQQRERLVSFPFPENLKSISC